MIYVSEDKTTYCVTYINVALLPVTSVQGVVGRRHVVVRDGQVVALLLERLIN